MKFVWHEGGGRGMATYYDDLSKRVYGRIVFDEGSRNYIKAEYCGPKVSLAKDRVGQILEPQTNVALGVFFDEKEAKAAVVAYVESLFPKKEELAA